ncbi:hypothetical protein BJY24_003525 [Nocardia transvalensis]|uniref:Uncharacterized protein n=1 Tax=Nocardia transvalensis TaxID=37333 RepID=A0A7W9UIQ9_9NOCA|nr:hypothetical protein [Nocardia transvalensis]MBB5914658.1 hypothetical protein [Nocardia transvalensis]
MREHRPPELAERNHEERSMFDIAYRRVQIDGDTQRITPVPVDGDPDNFDIVGESRFEPAILTSGTAHNFVT